MDARCTLRQGLRADLFVQQVSQVNLHVWKGDRGDCLGPAPKCRSIALATVRAQLHVHQRHLTTAGSDALPFLHSLPIEGMSMISPSISSTRASSARSRTGPRRCPHPLAARLGKNARTARRPQYYRGGSTDNNKRVPLDRCTLRAFARITELPLPGTVLGARLMSSRPNTPRLEA
jgi:hypothetical protein